MPDYFTLAEFRELPEMDDTTQYSDDRVEEAAAYIVGIIEREVGTSFIARNVTETLDGTGGAIPLSNWYVRSVTSATLNGVAVTEALSVRAGAVRRTSGYASVAWPLGSGNVSVTYAAGYSATPPADVKEAAMRGTRAYLLETSSRAGVTDRRSSITSDQGTTTYVLAGKDHPTGYPSVDAVIVGWRDKLSIPGFA